MEEIKCSICNDTGIEHAYNTPPEGYPCGCKKGKEKLPSAFSELGMTEDGWYIYRITHLGTRAQVTKWKSDNTFNEVDKEMIFRFMEQTVQKAIDKGEELLENNEIGTK